MIRFSANLSMLFLEVPELARPAAARRAGFDAVEVQFPYGHEAGRWRDALDAAGVDLALCNVPAGDLMTGGQGLAGVPGREAAFREAVAQAATVARVLKPRNINVLAGCRGPGMIASAAWTRWRPIWPMPRRSWATSASAW